MTLSPVHQWAQGFLNKFDLNGSKEVLDIGCRNGAMTRLLSNKYSDSHFTAIDSVHEKVSKAKEFSTSNATYETVDSLKMTYREDFHAVVSFSCLHWIRNKNQVLQNIYHSLKPGGKAYLQFFAVHGRLKNDRFFFHVAQKSKWKSCFKNFIPFYHEITAGELCTLLHNLGFVIHRLEFDRYQTTFSHPDSLGMWFQTWASHIDRIPARKKGHFLDEVVQAYRGVYQFSDNDTLPYQEYILEIICEKPHAPCVPNKSYQFANLVFTRHEAIVLKHYLLGKTTREIALVKSVSSKTVEFHLAKIREKMNCYRRSDIYTTASLCGAGQLIYDPAL